MYRYVGAGGIRWDPATGLYYMRARWYDPTLGRFLSLDPYVFCPSPYAYVLNSPSGLIDLTGATPGVWPGLNPGANNNNLTGIQAHNQFTVEFTQNLRQAGINPDDLRINQRVNLMDDQGNLTGNYMRPDAADPYGTVFKPVIDFKPTNPKAVSAGHRANKKMFKAIDNMHPEIPGQPRSHVVTAKRGDPAGISAAAQEACNIVKRGRGLKGVIGTLHSILGWVGLAFDIHQAWVDIQNINNGTGPSLEQPDYTGNPNGTGQPMIIFDPTTGLFEYVVDAKLPMT
jgi:RHS repeat-associated protein